MVYKLGYGQGYQEVSFPEQNLLGSLLPNQYQPTASGLEAIRQALAQPISSPALRQLVQRGEKIVIIVSDITRPCPTALMLPPLLEELYAAGISDSDIEIVFAIGIHRHQSQAEQRSLVGEAIFERITCIDSTPEDTVLLGTTSQGTLVAISRRVAQAGRRIALGNIEYHYFAGYSGGVKALMPGVADRTAIAHNHARMTMPQAVAGQLDGNPVRSDLEEALRFCPLDFILNVVLNEAKEVVHAVAGDPIAAHRAGCAILDKLYSLPIAQQADIVIATPGGAPKDLNLYQTQKALDNAKFAVKPGGTIILLGRCQEGFGEATFEGWMQEATTPQSLLQRIATNFELGGHKAAAIAQVLQSAEIYLVSEMDEATVRSCFMIPYASLQEALEAALARQGANASIYLMPYAGSTLPIYKS